MQRRSFLRASGAAALSAGCLRRTAPLAAPHKGIALDPWRARPTMDDFRTLRDLGATHLALFPFAYMRGYTETTVIRYDASHPRMDWSLTDEGYLEIGRMARAVGLRVVLIPTLADFVDGHWRGEVQMADEARWQAWFGSYRLFLLHYAGLARRLGAVGFSVGTELRGTVHREEDWSHTIALVRQTFGGWLTYAANWDDYAAVPWWDAMDTIGVQAYFELGDPSSDPVQARDQLVESWQPIVRDLKATSERWDRKIVFTEVGYKSHAGATIHPWDWEIVGDADEALQAHAYEAAFRACWGQPWFDGFYWWKWHPASGLTEPRPRDFTPQGKPAEEVLRRWYGL